jgi:hypothetical protein
MKLSFSINNQTAARCGTGRLNYEEAHAMQSVRLHRFRLLTMHRANRQALLVVCEGPLLSLRVRSASARAKDEEEAMTCSCVLCGQILQGPAVILTTPAFHGEEPETLKAALDLQEFDLLANVVSEHIGTHHAVEAEKMVSAAHLAGKMFAMQYGHSTQDPSFEPSRLVWCDLISETLNSFAWPYAAAEASATGAEVSE